MSDIRVIGSRRTRPRRERGQATIEIIGIIPLFMMILGAVIEVFLIGYAAVSAESSARLAARVASEGSSDSAAEEAALHDAPPLFDAQVQVFHDSNPSDNTQEPSVTSQAPPDSVSAEASYTVPFLGIGVDHLNITVRRYSVVPDTQ